MKLLPSRVRLLESVYAVTNRLLQPFHRWIKPGGMVERVFVTSEKIGKGMLFDCRMCGQCMLRSAGMTCPMTCPKNLRNGPCGGVRQSGHCEVKPDMICVWVTAWERVNSTATCDLGLLRIQPPVDRRLEGTSAWVNDISGRAHRLPRGWIE